MILQLVFMRVAEVANQTQGALAAQRAEEVDAGDRGARDQDRRVIEALAIGLQDVAQNRVGLAGQSSGVASGEKLIEMRTFASGAVRSSWGDEALSVTRLATSLPSAIVTASWGMLSKM